MGVMIYSVQSFSFAGRKATQQLGAQPCILHSFELCFKVVKMEASGVVR